MKVILYMAISANGMISKPDDDCSWVSTEEWAGFSAMIREVGNMIIGRRTHEIMIGNDEFNKSNLNKVKTIVLTEDTPKTPVGLDICLVRSPKEALDALKKAGFKTAMICGGGKLNSSFMKEGLVNEIYLDIEPIVFGHGIRLFEETDFEAQLELIETKKISKNEVQVHYKLKKYELNVPSNLTIEDAKESLDYARRII